jgi:ATP-dependent helicase Lhr and Lhr-like helicase
MKGHSKSLDLFHPFIRQWFFERLGAPTDIQTMAWPEIAKGKHALICAPTGSGKTLTAFLWAINQLVTGTWGTGQTRVLYISPLKALNNDIKRNLLTPLSELTTYFEKAGVEMPSISVLTRSGDTPPAERRHMLKNPPEILITTPESLNIILSSRSGRNLLTGIATVILDEIHALVGTKRGTHLISAVDRLVYLTGEFQRLALSATVKPIETVADFVGGYVMRGDGRSPHYEKRIMTIIRSLEKKKYSVNVRFPADARQRLVNGSWWPVLADAFCENIKTHQSSLLFVNSRRTAEKVARLINEKEPQELVYAHHGSLSKEIRLAVEQRLKDGELKAIVATSSLELGIDIGELDQVILIETPASVSSAIQRIGRSGHKVGEISHGVLYPTHGSDFLYAAVLAKSVTDQDIEPTSPIEAPLDVLSQIIISMVCLDRWDIDELYTVIRTSYPYRNLSRKAYDLVLSMLAGRYADTRLRELTARVSLDKIDNTIHGKEGVQRLIYSSGGTIPDRGYFDLRIEESKAKIGELDEEFVWERSIGDTFALGTHVWQIQRITPNDVEVKSSEAAPGIIPFWKAENSGRSFYFSEKILSFLEDVNDRLADPALIDELLHTYSCDKWAADELTNYLTRQREITGDALPHRHHILIEHFQDPLNTSDTTQVLLHTLWGSPVNRPFGLALQAAWEEKYHYHLEIIDNDECLLLMLPHGFSTEALFTLVTPENLERLIRKVLEKSGFFGARFRENAGRALLLPRASFKKRLPLWLNRLRSKKLLDAILHYPDFPILLETWRACLKDEFDLSSLTQLLDEVKTGHITVTEVVTHHASPFAEGLIWKQTNQYMYEDDSPKSQKTSALQGDLLKEVLSSSALRPRIPQDLVAVLESKLQRTAPGYAPRSPVDLLDWVKERFFIPLPEWDSLLAAMNRDYQISTEDIRDEIGQKLVITHLPQSSKEVVCALENLGHLNGAFFHEGAPCCEVNLLSGTSSRGADPGISEVSDFEGGNGRTLSDIFTQWLSFYGPVGKSPISDILGISGSSLDDLLLSLTETDTVIVGELTENALEEEVCDRENLEILLRMARKSRQPAFKALSADYIQLFLASWQGLTRRSWPTSGLDKQHGLQDYLDQLFGYPASADAWEKHIFPARMWPYYGSWLDNLMHTSNVEWFGCGKKKLTFAFDDDKDLFVPPNFPDHPELSRFFPQKIGKYSLPDIVRFSQSDIRSVTKKLWDLTWEGLITNDSFASVRQGLSSDFTAVKSQATRPRRFAMSHNRWGSPAPFPGAWHVLTTESVEIDPIDEAELVKDRVRQLFRRYGILFRELIAFELPVLQWSAVFRALRLMELSGEILSGYFFEGIGGIQFISHEAFRFLNQGLSEDSIYWLNATDPASMCGIKLESTKHSLPSRIPTTHLVFHGKKVVLISRRGGNTLTFLVAPDNPHMPEYLSFFKILVGREFSPDKIITVETINGENALQSSYSPALKEFGFSSGYKGLELVKKYGS